MTALGDEEFKMSMAAQSDTFPKRTGWERAEKPPSARRAWSASAGPGHPGGTGPPPTGRTRAPYLRGPSPANPKSSAGETPGKP